MYLFEMLFVSVILFFVIAGAVRWAIDPLVKSNSKFKSVQHDSLYRFRDEGILTEKDISDYKETVNSQKDYEEIREAYFDAKHVLKSLYEYNKITQEEYDSKLSRLTETYNME